MDVVLYEPEIPWNTGNIGRTCVAAGAGLHLIEPLGFDLDDRARRRAGLDYWEHLRVTRHASWRAFARSEARGRPLFLFSRFAAREIWEASFPENALLLFGSETKGLPPALRRAHRDQEYRIPTEADVRSLNLSTAVAVVLYEALRQQRLLSIEAIPKKKAVHRPGGGHCRGDEPLGGTYRRATTGR